MEEIKDRIKLIMDKSNMTAAAFAESIGVAPATITHILNGRNKPSTEILLRLNKRFPNISLQWLLLGDGELSNPEEKEINSTSEMSEILINPDEDTRIPNNRKEMASESPVNDTKDIVKQEVVYKERAPRRITEIRIFFDDNTYETFKPSKNP